MINPIRRNFLGGSLWLGYAASAGLGVTALAVSWFGNRQVDLVDEAKVFTLSNLEH
jgi:hypothetical protein